MPLIGYGFPAIPRISVPR